MNEWEWHLLEDKAPVNSLRLGGAEVKAGYRVRLRPRQGGDVLDIALKEQTAIVESIEQDYEGKTHICVVLEEDPCRGLGMLRQPGHRFFFDAEEIEPLPPEESSKNISVQNPRILVAGIGNIFFGDDGFGVEVVRRLRSCELPAEVRLVDFGIRGFDLACALQDSYETTILVDAFPHGQVPGAVSLLEPDLGDLDHPHPEVLEGHGMNPLNMLRAAKAMNGSLRKVLLVGCEPETLGGEDGQMGLSHAVEEAVDQAVNMVVSIVNKILQDGSINNPIQNGGSSCG